MASSNTGTNSLLIPEWLALPNVRACSTTRSVEYDGAVFNHFNLAMHVNDDIDNVSNNRQVLREIAGLPAEPVWLLQVHGDVVLKVTADTPQGLEADAAFTREKNCVCVVMTADCLPVLLCDKQATVVAAVHAGWRGLQQNIIAKTIQAMSVEPDSLYTWLGPAISPQAYEVDETVRQHFEPYEQAFKASRPGHWWMDLYAIARQQLNQIGVNAIYGGNHCTSSESERFFSHRREQSTGRMASLIWLK